MSITTILDERERLEDLTRNMAIDEPPRSRKPKGADGQSQVDRVYELVKAQAIAFAFKPGERINEVALAAHLGASRTPLREALNRLVAEGLLNFQQGQGFSCRALVPGEILDLYEAREAIEAEAARLACRRASDSDIAALATFLRETGPGDDGRSIEALVSLDEAFHLRIVALSGNSELRRLLENLNARLRFLRWIHMEARRPLTQKQHKDIVKAIAARDAAAAERCMRNHIHRRAEEVTAAVREGYSRLYVPESTAAGARR